MIADIKPTSVPLSPSSSPNKPQHLRMNSSSGQRSFGELVQHFSQENSAVTGGAVRFSEGNVISQADLRKHLGDFVKDWRRSNLELDKLSNRLPKEIKPLLDTQRLVYRMSVQSQLISRVGETLNSTIRRLQQFGGA